MQLKLAWRNIWRNKRRTAITAASIMFAVLLSTFMDAMQKGAWDNLISNVVNYYYGYVQVHQKGYWEEQTLEKSFEYDASMIEQAEAISSVETVLPRLESFALASSGNNTAGALIIGTNPEKEDEVTALKSRVVEGDYLATGDKAVLIAEGMSEQLKIGLGDTLVLIGQGFRGVNAAGKYPVKGIVNFGSPELNKQMVYMPLAETQWFYGAEGRLTSLAFGLKNPNKVKRTLQALNAQLDTSAYEIMDWEAMLPDLVEARTLDSGGNVVVYFILYMIIAFGIFGTILMMTKERSYEFGVLISIGMRRMKLARIVWLEVFFLGLLGAILGILLSIPLVAYFHVNPMEFSGSYSSTMERFGFEAVFPTLFRWDIFTVQALVIIIMTSILGLFPFYILNKLKPVQAMRS